MSTTLHPPIPYPSLDQQFLLLAGARIRPSQYHTLDFPPSFLDIYGRPTLTYYPWARLWNEARESDRIIEGVMSSGEGIGGDFMRFAVGKWDGERYLEWCKLVDWVFGELGDKGKGKITGITLPVGRLEMEGAWVKVLVGMYDEMRGDRDMLRGYVGMRVGRGEGRILMSSREVQEEMKDVLRRAVAQRFSKKVEEYWERKWRVYGYRFPDLDVKCVTDHSIEAPFQKSLLKPEDVNNNDYDETDDERNEREIDVEGKEGMREGMEELKKELEMEPKNK
ncbi:hypothetical protein SBOR_4935 [Sclerotinia borealis F-4128]|uniref:Uncharacterized protein n=1 Tax=Sclerotinia borealis (strain F-4128) TaxID=1432307 RepID=W9CJ22_SCLBF|nr:hypothetical protein SBOR_4935 [Sclerotinia borealis F-4128]